MPAEQVLIEFLEPDERAFGPVDGGSAGGRGAGETFVGLDGGLWDDDSDRSSPSRWLPVLAGIAVTGLVASGVFAAAPWSGDDAAATSTTVALQGTTVPTPLRSDITAPVDASLDGWLLDPVPVGVSPAYFARGDEFRDDGSAWGEVWATPGATRVSGRWFSITLQPFLDFSPAKPELWFPVDVAGRPGHARVTADGVVTLSYEADQISRSRLITIDAFGIGLEQLTVLADSIAIVDDRPQLVDDRPEFTRPELLDGLTQIAAAATADDLTTSAIIGGIQRTRALYTGPGPSEVTLVQEQALDLTAGEGDITALMALAFTPVLLPDGWGPKGDFGGADLVVGYRTLDDIDITIARWLEGETEVSLLTTRDLGELLVMLPDVELASAEDWAAAERSIDTTSRIEATPRTPPGITVDAGTLDDGTGWSVTHWPSSDEWDVRVDLTTFTTPRPRPTAVIPVTIGATTLLLVHTDVADASAIVTFADGASTNVDLAATDPADRTSMMGVTPIEQRRAFVVDVSTPDGTVVHRFAPWEPTSVARNAAGSVAGP